MKDLNLWKDFTLQYQNIGAKVDVAVDGLAFSILYRNALESDRYVTSWQFSGSVNQDKEYFYKKLTEMGGKLIIKNIGTTVSESFFLWPDAIVDVSTYSNNQITVNLLSNDEELAQSIKKFVEETKTIPSKKGYIFAIMRSGSSLHLQRIGFAGTPLEEGNYGAKVLEGYKTIVKDLRSPLPSGRIAIFDGPSGSGKSFLARALLMEVPDALFVLVPPTMVSSLGGPDLLPMLLNYKESYSKSGPTIFLLEDADECLAPRASDNMGAISSILNMGDGIFGSLFDIRIVATTNAKQKDMDAAILRAGRLSERVTVGRLSYEEANKIFQRLLPDQNLSKPEAKEEQRSLRPTKEVADFSLAEIYKAARDAGWVPPTNKEPDELSDLEDEYPALASDE